MDKNQALTFEFQSATNAKKIEDEVHRQMECSCKAYIDIFPFNRWKAQGMRVPKGSIKVTILLPKAAKSLSEVTDKPSFITKTINVWCRCQVTKYEKITSGEANV
jgi:hypothetical protein